MTANLFMLDLLVAQDLVLWVPSPVQPVQRLHHHPNLPHHQHPDQDLGPRLLKARGLMLLPTSSTNHLLQDHRTETFPQRERQV